MEELREVSINDSLFTNIPLKQTIKLAADLINTSYLNLKYQVIILLSCSNLQHMKHFLFNGKFYDQIDGVAMGSPLAPVLTNIFLRHKILD